MSPFQSSKDEAVEEQTPRLRDRAEVTRRKLLAAAEEVFAEQGFFRTSISAITRRAGVAQGTFYLHYKTKEDIFRELVRQMSHDLRRELQEAVAPIAERPQAEQVGFQTFLRFVLRRRNLYIVLRECEFVDPDLYRWYYDRLAEGYVRGLRLAIARGQVRSLDPEAVAYALMGAFQMAGMRWVLWNGEVPPDEVVESIVSLMLYGMMPTGRRPPSVAAQPTDAAPPDAIPGDTMGAKSEEG